MNRTCFIEPAGVRRRPFRHAMHRLHGRAVPNPHATHYRAHSIYFGRRVGKSLTLRVGQEQHGETQHHVAATTQYE